MLFEHPKNEVIVPPYSRLASIYDDVMCHVDYKQWARYIQTIIAKWCPDATTVLDISCGTGSLLAKLDSRSYRLFGFDLSVDMALEAIKKHRPPKFPIQFWCGDMKNFCLKKNIDVAICLYDSINYLLDFEAWRQCFESVFACLREEGIFIFDICTERNSLKYFRNYTERRNQDRYQYFRVSKFDAEANIHTNRFEIDFDGDGQKYIEIHRQYIYPVKDVEAFIAQSRFQQIAAYDGFTFRSAHKNSLRIHFILKKNRL